MLYLIAAEAGDLSARQSPGLYRVITGRCDRAHRHRLPTSDREIGTRSGAELSVKSHDVDLTRIPLQGQRRVAHHLENRRGYRHNVRAIFHAEMRSPDGGGTK